MPDYTIVSAKPTYCKSCGREIVWGKTQKGKYIPLELTPLQPHFISCPQSKEWKRSQ